MKIEIKPAYDRIESIKELFTEYTSMLGVNLEFQKFDQELEQLPGKYALPYGRLYIAGIANQAMGCVALRRRDDLTCEMKRLYVRPEFRGLKIGQKLAEKVIEDARTMKYEFMVLDTFTTLNSAVVLYRKLGFYEVEPYYNNPLDNVIYMQLKL